MNPLWQETLRRMEILQATRNEYVAEPLRPGYLWEGRLHRPEMVSGYVYCEVGPESIDDFEKRTSDE
jgi:hypothetical protein